MTMPGRFAAMGRVLAATWPALVLGLATGATGGVLAAAALDPTPYGRTEYNTIARNAHQAGRSDGWQAAQQTARQVTARLREANETRVGLLREELDATLQRVTSLKESLAQAQRTAQERGTQLLEVKSSLAEKTVALENATRAPADAEHTQHVEGSLRVTTTVPVSRASSQGCADALDAHGVTVVAGADVTVAVARLVGADAATRTRRGDKVELTCTLVYAVDLPTPLGSAYHFLPTGGRNGSAPGAKVPGSSLEDGSGPRLSTAF